MNYFYHDGKITRDHGRLIKLDEYNVYPVYHPAAALRNGNFAKALLKDFMQIPDVIEKIKNGETESTDNAYNNPLGL